MFDPTKNAYIVGEEPAMGRLDDRCIVQDLGSIGQWSILGRKSTARTIFEGIWVGQ